MTTIKTISLPDEIAEKIKDNPDLKGRISKICAEAIANELDTGRVLERLKKKKRIYEQKVITIQEKIEFCEKELAMQKTNKKQNKKMEKASMDSAVENCIDRLRKGHDVPVAMLHAQAKLCKWPVDDFEKVVCAKAVEENLSEEYVGV
jgi:uncharacterized NAD(P)/FAD-binding protein YdhS